MKEFDENTMVEHRIAHQILVASAVRDAISSITAGWHNNDLYLMGGAPRNWEVGAPAKDLDFFLTTPISSDAALEDLLLRLMPGKFVSSQYFEEGQEGGRYQSVTRRALFNFEVEGELVQLLVNKSDYPAFEEWRTFPCTQSMVKWDFDNNRTVPLVERRVGDSAHYFRFEDEDNPKDSEMNYFEKLREYFPAQEYKILSGRQNLPYLLFQYYKGKGSGSKKVSATTALFRGQAITNLAGPEDFNWARVAMPAPAFLNID